MLSRWIAALASVGLMGLAAGARAETAQDLQTLLASAMAGGHVPAMGAAVIRDGKIEAMAVRGVRRADQPAAVQLTDSWIIGSTAKPQTAALIARLVDRGVMSWDAPLAKMLPDLAEKMRPEYRAVTLVQLLSHQSGLPENIADLSVVEAYFKDPRPVSAQRLDYIARALAEAPAYAPGTDSGYSNTGFLIAAAVAERATVKTYETLIRQEVFAPLGMTTAGFAATGPGQPMGHDKGKPVGPSNPDMFAPAGNLHMSLGDWAKFNADQLAGAKGRGRLLSAASYRLMQTQQPHAPNGLDWGVQSSIAGRKGPALIHGGSDGYWFAYVVLFPETGNGGLVIDNASAEMGGDAAAKTVLKALLAGLAPPQ
ncbi:serine hydrolase domain-containing protein [Phenylobacterium aquaticum]|uniref:serine hydrolase domain-containing protein n=1 Tax=Phenylobacterium aquaticum TaxID=1763816 RepID=UPI001F5E1D0C|nr:serine hydrolase domain-containing protein [Phenylobacterium aquaticum]MCI3133184.1 beta-lactamase family protein [Phenylobacterium aquaticum]